MGFSLIFLPKQNEAKQTPQNQTYLAMRIFPNKLEEGEKDNFHPIPVRLTGEPPSRPLLRAHGVFDQMSTGHLDHYDFTQQESWWLDT